MADNNSKGADALGLIFVEIDGTGVDQGRTYKDATTGLTKPLPGKQTAFIHCGKRYPLEVAMPFPDGSPPYRPGLYLLAGAVFESGKYGRIEFIGDRSLELVPVSIAVDFLTSTLDKADKPPVVKAA